MYSYVNAYVKPRGRQSRWQEADLSATQLYTLWDDYSRVYLILSNPVLETNVALDLEKAKSLIVAAAATSTVTQWLVGLGNASLPTEATLPVLDTQYLKTRDAYYAGYEIQPVHRTASPDAVMPRMEKRDLLLTKDGMSYQQFFDYCLPTVNGFVHRPELTTYGIQVLEGAQSAWLSNQTQVGILSFEAVAKLTTVSIDPSWVYQPSPNQSLGQVCHIRVPQDLTGKTVLPVIGGYLHPLTDFFKEVGDGHYRLDFNNYPLLERFYESRTFVDLTTMTSQMTIKDGTYDQVALEELYSDGVIRALLALPQTFLVILDTPEVFVEYEDLEGLPTPGRYISRSTPEFPLALGYGRLMEYWPMPEQDRWVLMVNGNLKPEYNFNTFSWWGGVSVSNHRNTLVPYRYSRGAYLKLGRDL